MTSNRARPIHHRRMQAHCVGRRGSSARIRRAGWLLTAAVVLIGSRTARAELITVDFRSMGTFFADELSLDGLVIRNESSLGPLGILNLNGLGTYYTRLDSYIRVEIGDEVEFDFTGVGGVTEATLWFPVCSGPAICSVELDRYFQGIDEPVGPIGYSGEHTLRHVNPIGLPPLERLVLRPIGSTLRVGTVSYIPAPEPSTVALAGICLLLVAPWARRQRAAASDRLYSLTERRRRRQDS